MFTCTLTAFVVLCCLLCDTATDSFVNKELHFLPEFQQQCLSYSISQLDMCVTTYTREQLISVNNNTLRPSSAVLSSISDCVLTVSHHQQSQKRRKTRRGHRAGRKSCHTISSMIGNRPHDVHRHQTQSLQCHLVNLQKVTLRNCSGTGTNLKVGSVNAQSVRNKVDELTNIIIHNNLDVWALADNQG